MSSFDAFEGIALGRAATPEEIVWLQDELLPDTRNLTLVTDAPDGTSHITTFYSAPTGRFAHEMGEPEPALDVLGISNVETDHVRHIRIGEWQDEPHAKAVGRLAVSRVKMNILHSQDTRPSLRLWAGARLLRPGSDEEVLAHGIINDIRRSRVPREKQEAEYRGLEPKGKYKGWVGIIACRVDRAMIQVPTLEAGEYSGEGHASVLPFIQGFDVHIGKS